MMENGNFSWQNCTGRIVASATGSVLGFVQYSIAMLQVTFFFLTYFLFSSDADVGDDSADGDTGEGH